MRRASEQAGQQEGEQHRRTTDPAPDEETNKNRSDRGGAPRTGRGGQTGRLAECADAKQHGVEGGAPHRAEAFVAIEYEDAGKKGNLHLQTSQQQTRGQADRPDAQTVATKQPDIQTETPEGRRSEPLISTTKRQGWGGQRGGQPQESTKQNQKPRTNNRTSQRSKPTNKGGQGQAHPSTRRPKIQETQQRQNKKPQRPTTKAKGKDIATITDQGRALYLQSSSFCSVVPCFQSRFFSRPKPNAMWLSPGR